MADLATACRFAHAHYLLCQSNLISEDQMAEEDLKALLAEEIANGLRWSEKYRKIWSFAFHFTAYAVILLSGIAAYIAATQPSLGNVVAAISITVTILTGIQTVAGMDRKWATYRITRTELEKLRRDMAHGEEPLTEINNRLHEFYKAHNQAVLGGIRVDAVDQRGRMG